MNHLTYSIKASCITLFLAVLFINSARAQSETVQFRSKDKVLITADLYANKPATAPFIILFHQRRGRRSDEMGL